MWLTANFSAVNTPTEYVGSQRWEKTNVLHEECKWIKLPICSVPHGLSGGANEPPAGNWLLMIWKISQKEWMYIFDTLFVGSESITHLGITTCWGYFCKQTILANALE